MKEESIEEKIRKIQSLFLDQVEVRLFTDTEIDQDGKKYYAFCCSVFCVDDDFHNHDLHFAPESDTNQLGDYCSMPLNTSVDSNFSDALDELYNECVLHINHGYSVYSDEPMIIAIAASLDSQ